VTVIPDVAAVVGSVATVRVVVPLPLTVAGLNEQVAPCGRPEQLRVTVPLKLFSDAIVTVDVALLPAEMLAGLKAVAEIPKSGVLPVTVRVSVVVLTVEPAVPVTVTVLVPAGVLPVVLIVSVPL